MTLCVCTKVSAGQGHTEEAVLRLGLLGYPRQDVEPVPDFRGPWGRCRLYKGP